MRARFLWCALVAVSVGCGKDASAPDVANVVVSITAGSDRFSPGNPTQLSISVENKGRSVVSFGYGSSDCWMRYTVTRDGAEASLGTDIQACSADWTLRSLAPGESHTEESFLDGVLRDRVPHETIEPGIYEIRGAIADFVSEPLQIEFHDAP